MKWKNRSKFALFGLNQEKTISELSKHVTLSDVNRVEKTKTLFECSFFDQKRVKKLLFSKNAKFEQLESTGVIVKFSRIFSSYGLILALVFCSILSLFQSRNVVQFEIVGLDNLTKSEIVEFVSENYSLKKDVISTDEIEVGLTENFEQISFVSCIVKGQTLVINIKEKLLPDEMYGSFVPIVAAKSGKITSISLVSGTLNVEVGDYVQAGDILVLPYVLDSAGVLKKVEASAEICAEVYNVGTAEHYESQIVLERTGNVSVESRITLFGLTIYTFSDGADFALYEVEEETLNMTENLFLPFKITKTTKFEVIERQIDSNFDDVKDEVIEAARAEALSGISDEAEVSDEYYAVRHVAGLSIVTYTIVTNEKIS